VVEVLRRNLQSGDHYYWLTTLLAARGLQRTVCRMVAAIALVFGAISVLLTASEAGPRGLVGQFVAFITGAGAVVIAAGWLRPRWPTRAESMCFVVLATVCIAAACLVQSRPLAGALGTAAFAVLACYAGLFHGGRLLLMVTTSAVLTTGVLSLRVAESWDPVLAFCAMATLTAVYVLLPVSSSALVRLLELDKPNSEIDALTGLLNPEAFHGCTGELLSVRGRLDDRYLVIVHVALDNFGLLVDTRGHAAGDRARVAVAQALRETTRVDAIVGHSEDGDFLITDTFQSPDTAPLTERVRSQIATTPPRLTASIGVVTTPLRDLAGQPPDAVLEELLERAAVAMREARRAGGNQVRYVISPKLAALEDNDDEPT
jgi:diguanylate cyclase (GGDEF)-like protein